MSRRRRYQASSRHRPGRRKHEGAERKPTGVPIHEEPFADSEIQAVRAAVDLDPEWDVILVGDGSVDNDLKTCGWASVLYDRASGSRRTFFGASSSGSCLVAELTPLVQAILWYARSRGRRLLKRQGVVRVAVVTDSQIIAAQGLGLRQAMGDQRRLQATRALWTTFDQLAGMGYEVRWSWIRRGSLEIHKDMNRLAQSVRWRMSRVLEPDE